MEEAREAVKKKNIVREMWTDGSVKEKENKAPGPGRGGGGYTITRWTDGVAKDIANQSATTGIWATSFMADVTTAVTVVIRLIDQ